MLGSVSTALSAAQRRHILMSVLQLVDLTVVAASLVFTIGFLSRETSVPGWWSVFEIRLSLRNVLFGVGYVLAWNVVLRSQGLYESHRLISAWHEVTRVGTAVVIAILPLVPLRHLLHLDALGGGGVEIFGLTVFPALVVERRLLRGLAKQIRLRGRNLRSVLFVGDAAEASEMTEQLTKREGLGYRVVATVDMTAGGERDGHEQHAGILEAVERELAGQSIDEVFVALPLLRSRGVIEGLVSLCEQEGVTVRLLPRLADLQWAWASVDTVLGQPVITISSVRPQEAAMLVKRALDVVVSAIVLLVLAPVLVLIAIAIKVDSRGPVIFAQERVGYNRRRFRTLKFRTMGADAPERQAEFEHLNEAEGPVFKIRDDPRVTRVGRFLRRTSLDELPQFLNVLQGDMSLVGPRPLPVRDFQRIEVRWHRRRFSVKPGLTCLWQVAAREPKFNDWVRMDMEYIDNWSLRLDFQILAKTIPAVLSRHGAH